MTELEMMNKLEEARQESITSGKVIAIGNGKEVDWLYGDVESTDDCLNVYKSLGYWVVSIFIGGFRAEA